MTGRVSWGSYNGHDIETVVAIMLSLEDRRSQRVRPASGDGGIDVMVPHSPTRWEVYQVKGFSTRLAPGHKAQITSLNLS